MPASWPRAALAVFLCAAAPGCGLALDFDPPDLRDPNGDACACDAGPRDAGSVDAGVLDAPSLDAWADAAANADAPDGAPADGGSDRDARGEPDVGGTERDGSLFDARGLAPTCEIEAPSDGFVADYDVPFTFVAVATDPEDGPLAGPSIVWRSDRVVAPLGSGLTVSVLLEPGVHVVTCVATDADGNRGTDSIVVTSRSPVARIGHPGSGETRPASMSVPFVGEGRDFEDGTLSGASLVWTSDRDGLLGSGASFNRSLSPGTHVVTLTATDSDGNTGTDTVVLTITP